MASSQSGPALFSPGSGSSPWLRPASNLAPGPGFTTVEEVEAVILPEMIHRLSRVALTLTN